MASPDPTHFGSDYSGQLGGMVAPSDYRRAAPDNFGAGSVTAGVIGLMAMGLFFLFAPLFALGMVLAALGVVLGGLGCVSRTGSNLAIGGVVFNGLVTFAGLVVLSVVGGLSGLSALAKGDTSRRPTETSHASATHATHKSTEPTKPTKAKPTESSKPTKAKPTKPSEPTEMEAPPTKPEPTKPADTTPEPTKPAETKPEMTKPTATKPMATKPAPSEATPEMEKRAQNLLNLAEDLLKDRTTRVKGLERLDELIKQFPTTKAAARATKLLAQ